MCGTELASWRRGKLPRLADNDEYGSNDDWPFHRRSFRGEADFSFCVISIASEFQRMQDARDENGPDASDWNRYNFDESPDFRIVETNAVPRFFR